MLAILDYGIGNVRSVLNAFAYLGIDAKLTRDIGELGAASGLVLPGVGAFGEGMRRLDQHGLDHAVTEFVASNRPILGICLGFQMLMASSTEQGTHRGLSLLPLEVVRLPVSARLPHIGWSQVSTPAGAKASYLMQGLEDEFFYFVHSYGVVGYAGAARYASAIYDDCELVALIEQDNVLGTQFHPEKSGEAGLQLLRNFARLAK